MVTGMECRFVGRQGEEEEKLERVFLAYFVERDFFEELEPIEQPAKRRMIRVSPIQYLRLSNFDKNDPPGSVSYVMR